jgi:hypothetical protein
MASRQNSENVTFSCISWTLIVKAVAPEIDLDSARKKLTSTVALALLLFLV